MTTKTIRKKLISYIADADDKKIKGLYMLVEDDISRQQQFQLSDSEVKLLEEERRKHITGKSKSYTWTEAKTIIRSKAKQ
ncbi:MAG: hypothetical protein JNM88_11645 [Chitinophagaceae bacterium]|nr:hypothetical protein [Chitinophagaceae bacterium]